IAFAQNSTALTICIVTSRLSLQAEQKLPKLGLLNFAQISARKLVKQEYLLRRDPDVIVFAETLFDLFDIHRAARHDRDPELLQAGAILDAADGCFLYPRHGFDDLLDAGRGQLDAADIDNVRSSAGNTQDAILGEASDVAGVDPAIV